MKERQQMESSAVESVAYDSESRQLTITYVGSHTYIYFDVDESVYAAFLDAESKGRFVNEVVKRQGYQYEKLR